MSEQLFFIHHVYGVKIHAFVLMSNHFHLLISCPNGNLSEAMSWFMRETSRAITKASDRINQTYGGRFSRTLIETEHHFKNVYKYVYRNPVTAGICDNVEVYQFSTLSGLLGQSHMIIPLEPDTFLFDNVEREIRWLNKKPKKEHLLDVKTALKKAVFRLPRDRDSRKKNKLEIDAL